jgi:hypothetical protein
MRFSSKVFCRKFNQIRKQNWSAPALMSVLIIISMICIFSLESLGLLNNTKNLNHRLTTPELSIKILNEEKQIQLNEEKLLKEEKIQIKSQSIQSQIHERKITALNDLLYEAALQQMLYEKKVDLLDEIRENNFNEDILVLFDI